MATGQLNGVFKKVRRIARLRDLDRLSDADLLDCFIIHNEESAFEGLLRRHGPMVLGVCQRVLANPHDAEDAFQAVFLVLARKAATVQPRALVGNWLYGVAYRTALKARSMIAKRQAREKQVLEMPEAAARPEAARSDLRPRIDQELNRLADKYRVPVVLCDLEGKSQRDAARQLGWPEGTLMTRLARARQILAERLSRQGIALSAGALAALLTHNAASASLPMTLTRATVKAAALAAAGHAATAVSAEVAALAEGVISAMFVAKIKSAAVILFVVAILGSGVGLCTQGVLPEGPSAFRQRVEDRQFTVSVEQERGGREGRDDGSISGKIVGVAKDGKSITLETPPVERGGEPVKQTIKLNDKTELKYFGVGPGGAKLTEGSRARIWPTDGAKDVAAKIQIGGKVSYLGPDISGQVTGISKDGATLSIETGRKGGSGKTVEVKLTINTVLIYSGVEQGGTKPTVGYTAAVWSKRGSKTAAAAINFHAPHHGAKLDRGAGQAGLSGRLTAIANGGKLITVEKPPQERGGQAEQVEIKLTDKTRIFYNNIPPDGAKLTEGSAVQVSLAEGSKDTAASVTQTPPKGQIKEPYKSVHGKVVSVAKDGKSVTLEGPPRRAQPAEQWTIKLTKETRVIYNNVGPNGARLTEGYSATASLDEGSPDTAFLLILGPAPEGGRR
jgi:RNA polymerase sigma factor (sigma-70 family)